MQIEGNTDQEAQALVYDEVRRCVFLVVGKGPEFNSDSQSTVYRSVDAVLYDFVPSTLEEGEFPGLRLQGDKFGGTLQFLPFGSDKPRWQFDGRELIVLDLEAVEVYLNSSSGVIVIVAGSLMPVI